jgi:hypothetical protein
MASINSAAIMIASSTISQRPDLPDGFIILPVIGFNLMGMFMAKSLWEPKDWMVGLEFWDWKVFNYFSLVILEPISILEFLEREIEFFVGRTAVKTLSLIS